MKKRLFSLFLSLIMVMGALPASAANSYNYTYNKEDEWSDSGDGAPEIEVTVSKNSNPVIAIKQKPKDATHLQIHRINPITGVQNLIATVDINTRLLTDTSWNVTKRNDMAKVSGNDQISNMPQYTVTPITVVGKTIVKQGAPSNPEPPPREKIETPLPLPQFDIGVVGNGIRLIIHEYEIDPINCFSPQTGKNEEYRTATHFEIHRLNSLTTRLDKNGQNQRLNPELAEYERIALVKNNIFIDRSNVDGEIDAQTNERTFYRSIKGKATRFTDRWYLMPPNWERLFGDIEYERFYRIRALFIEHGKIIAQSEFNENAIPIGKSPDEQQALTEGFSTTLPIGTKLLFTDEPTASQDYDIVHNHDEATTKIWIWDYGAEDGDYVQVLVNGVPLDDPLFGDQFMIKHEPIELTVPSVAAIQIKGVKDGVGGITYALNFELNGTTYFNCAPEGDVNTYTLRRG